ncbi:MAG: hypothetical protein JSS38_20055 [Nitrospira sp.]|nr:hypothetical protein [Nitrospira sp.]
MSCLLQHQSPKQIEMFGAAQPMVAGDEPQIKRETGVATQQLIGKPLTPLR